MQPRDLEPSAAGVDRQAAGYPFTANETAGQPNRAEESDVFKEAELSPKRKKIFWIVGACLAVVAGVLSSQIDGARLWLSFALIAVLVALYALLGGFRRSKPDDQS
jgi:hypothetical protein